MISNELVKARHAAGMTQQQLSDVTGIAQCTISQYESGARAPRIATYQKLMVALGKPAALPAMPKSPDPAPTLGEWKQEPLDRIIDHLLGRLLGGEDEVLDKLLSVMDAACLLKANHALAADEALEELGLVDWHRGVIGDTLEIKKPTSAGTVVTVPYGETAKSKSARELARLTELIGERRKTHVLRRELQTVIAGLAMLVREKLRQASAQGRIEHDVAKEILDALAAESRRRWADVVYG